jgi:predicted phosphodiesterase
MRIVSPEKDKIVGDAIRENPETPSRTLARLLIANHPTLWASLEDARSYVRMKRGNIGKQNRRTHHDKSLFRPNQKAGFKWEFPPSLAQPWETFILDSEKNLVLSDIHIPFHDPQAIGAVVKFGKKYRPDTIILNGDTCDFFTLSRFLKNPTVTQLKTEIDSTRSFLGWLRAQFPKARIIFKEGNHDERFAKYVWAQAPLLSGLPKIDLKTILLESANPIGGIEWIGDQGKIKAGHLTILHGHELGRGSIAPPVNPARGFFLKGLECILAGHLHRDSHHPETTMNGRLISCWSTGCLCGLYPDYAKVNKWTHSFATVELAGDDFSVKPIRILHGKIL